MSFSTTTNMTSLNVTANGKTIVNLTSNQSILESINLYTVRDSVTSPMLPNILLSLGLIRNIQVTVTVTFSAASALMVNAFSKEEAQSPIVFAYSEMSIQATQTYTFSDGLVAIGRTRLTSSTNGVKVSYPTFEAVLQLDELDEVQYMFTANTSSIIYHEIYNPFQSITISSTTAFTTSVIRLTTI
jgi:hypothetical protein